MCGGRIWVIIHIYGESRRFRCVCFCEVQGETFRRRMSCFVKRYVAAK